MKQLFEIQYFGNVNYYSALIKSNHYEICAYDRFQKMSFMNRCRILGANGPIDLSIPLVGGREIKLPVKEVKISYKEDWRSQHLRSIVSAYNRSPWFFQYENQLRELYDRKYEYLLEWNLAAHRVVKNILSVNFNEKINKNDGQVDNEDTDLTRYLPKSPNPQGLQFPAYVQVFSDRFEFVRDLSILDLLFCEGPRSVILLKEAAK